jgi:DNA-binding NarL/FixJ family response regulator
VTAQERSSAEPPRDVGEIAAKVVTEKQQKVWELREKRGHSIYAIGYAPYLSPSTVRGHLAAATRRTHRSLDRRSRAMSERLAPFVAVDLGLADALS